MKKLMTVLALLLSLHSISVNAKSLEEKNIAIVKNMFSDFAEKKNINALDTYYTKNFVLESNGKKYSYAQYKKIETDIYKTLSSLKIVSYEDIFAAQDKVVSRMRIKLSFKNGKSKEFLVILIAQIKDAKINKLWEVTYPGWE